MHSLRSQVQKTKVLNRLSFSGPSFRSAPMSIYGRQLHSTILQNDKTNDESSVLDGLEANSRWRKGQLSKITDTFENAGKGGLAVRPVPMEINSDDEVQPMWKDMESRVTRRRAMTKAEATAKGKKIGRSNVRKTDEEAWLSAGLYDQKDR